jgi:hypothetical protein
VSGEGNGVSGEGSPPGIGKLPPLLARRLSLEPALTGLGGGGMALALVCLAGAAVLGARVPPEGRLLDAAAFNAGVGVFLLTFALLLPVAGLRPGTRGWARGLFLVFSGYGLALETVQSFRGLNPRFSPHHGTVDMLLGNVFGFTAFLLSVAFVLVGIRFFRRDVLPERPVLRAGIAWGVVAVALSFGVGILMSVMQGRAVGAAGNLIPAHGLGVHGIQALPLLALLLTWGRVHRARPLVHLAGAAWVGGVLAQVTQALRGAPPVEVSLLPILTGVGLALWAGVLGVGLVGWRKAAAH